MTSYVIVDDSNWGESTVVPKTQWPRIRATLLDEWEMSLRAAGGDPALPFEDYLAENPGCADILLDAASRCSGRAERAARRAIREADHAN